MYMWKAPLVWKIFFRVEPRKSHKNVKKKQHRKTHRKNGGRCAGV